MKIYVAGRTTELDKVREVQTLCWELGHTITHDWTRAAPEAALRAGGKGPAYVALPGETKRQYAEADLAGAGTCDVLIAVCGEGWCGTLIEIGHAIGWAADVWLLGTPERESVFWHLPQVTRVPDLDALRERLAGL